MKIIRPDKMPGHRSAYEKNRKKILSTQNICGICGKEIDMTLKTPNPLAPCVDHIIPVAKGGHPSDINNLQLAHWQCNRQKSDKLFLNIEKKKTIEIGNRNLPQSNDWINYKEKWDKGGIPPPLSVVSPSHCRLYKISHAKKGDFNGKL